MGKNKIKSKNRRVSFSWLSPKLHVKDTHKYGKGVFAKKNINKDELLSIFGGYVIDLREETGLPEKVVGLGIQINEDYFLGPRKVSEIDDACGINHSCEPNAGLKGQIYLVAMRPIEKGEEITFDYCMVLYHSPRIKSFVMKCDCGSKKCRNTVTDYDWKKPDLQKKYKGYFSYFLQEKINLKNKQKNGF
jgi:uncharacterized protein